MMSGTRRMMVSTWLVAIGLAAGCSTATSAPPAIDSPFEGFEHYNGVTRLCTLVQANAIGPDDVTEVNATAAQMIALIAGKHRHVLHFDPPGDEASSSQTPITIEIEMASAPRWMDGMDEPLYHGATCPSWLQADVNVTLRTDDGAIAERFAAYAWMIDPTIVHISAAATNVVHGSLTDWITARLPEAPLRFTLEIAYAAEGGGATIDVFMPIADAGFHTPYSPVTVGYIGTTPCTRRRAPISLDSGDLLTGDQLLSRFTFAQPLHIEWNDGSNATLDAHFMAEHAGACLSAYEQGTSLAIEGTLALDSDDGRLHGRYATSIAGQRVAQADVGLSFLVNGLTAAEAGFPQVAQAGLLDVEVHVDVQVNAANELAGSVELIGRFDNDCTDEIERGEQCGSYLFPTLHAGTITR